MIRVYLASHLEPIEVYGPLVIDLDDLLIVCKQLLDARESLSTAPTSWGTLDEALLPSSKGVYH